MRKYNTALLDKVNQALKDVKADGTYAKVYKEWCGVEPPASQKPSVSGF